MPSGPTVPAVWMLGSSEYGAALAADFGLPYTFAHFIGGDARGVARERMSISGYWKRSRTDEPSFE